MARRGVRYQADIRDEAGPAAPRSVPRWWRGPDPDPAVVGRLYMQEGRTETEIAVLLSISRARVAAVLRDAGIGRRTSRKDCPVDADTLREIVQAGSTVAAVAREYGVSHTTAARWFTEAGLLGADPGVDPRLLRELYADRQLSTREVAAELGINKARVIRALTAAGIIPAAVRAVALHPQRLRGGPGRHHRPQGSPPPCRITLPFLSAAYTEIGVAASHMSS